MKKLKPEKIKELADRRLAFFRELARRAKEMRADAEARSEDRKVEAGEEPR